MLDIQRIIERLKEKGIGILITDHNVRDTLNITDRAYIINDGKILREGTPEQLTNDDEVKKVYLGENFRLEIDDMNRRPFLRQTLDLRLSQRLALTPSLLQKIELLQLNKLELQEMLNQELVENPILEEVLEPGDSRGD